jgi:hypothetical protein
MGFDCGIPLADTETSLPTRIGLSHSSRLINGGELAIADILEGLKVRGTPFQKETHGTANEPFTQNNDDCKMFAEWRK